MAGHFQLSHDLDVKVLPNPEDGGTVVFRPGKSNELSLNLYEWQSLFLAHNRISTLVHKQWRGEGSEQPEQRVKRWKGLPLKEGQTLHEVDPLFPIMLTTLLNMPLESDDESILNKIRDYLDIMMEAVPVGETKRLRVRFSANDTQVHFFTYNPRTLAVTTLLQLKFHEWLELHKHFFDISRLMGKAGKPMVNPTYSQV